MAMHDRLISSAMLENENGRLVELVPGKPATIPVLAVSNAEAAADVGTCS